MGNGSDRGSDGRIGTGMESGSGSGNGSERDGGKRVQNKDEIGGNETRGEVDGGGKIKNQDEIGKKETRGESDGEERNENQDEIDRIEIPEKRASQQESKKLVKGEQGIPSVQAPPNEEVSS